MRKKIIIGNWKMYHTLNSMQEFIKQVESITFSNIDAGIAIQFPLLIEAKKQIKNLMIVAQDCGFEDEGAFTGVTSPKLLKEIGVNYVILGHSERRNIFFETNEMINKKLLKALKNNLNVILCCGETEEEYNSKITKDVINKQLSTGLKDVDIKDLSNIIIAYEPVWAIGTGKTATIEVAQEICHFIRQYIKANYNSEVSNQIRIQYGGSVNSENIKSLLSQKDIDGALVGSASLKSDSFIKLIS